jgi:hypothetical protein
LFITAFAESFLMLSPSGTQAGNLAHHSDGYDAELIIPPDLREEPRRPVNSDVLGISRKL